MKRTAKIQRSTKETQIELSVNLDGNGKSSLSTGIGFFEHLLTLFAAHSLIDLQITAKGDLHVDGHHLVEDIGIALGEAVKTALGDKSGIRRYGHFTLPMDETLLTAAVDFSGRPFLVHDVPFASPKIGDFDTELVREFWQGFSNAAACNLHQLCHYGANSHHKAEALFKATARAVKMSLEFDERQKGIPSTKGVL